MKKILMTLALVLASQLAYCQTFNEVANQLKTLPNAQYQELPKDMVKLVTANIEDEAVKKVFGNVECMKMLSIADADEKTRATFVEKVSSFKTRYERVAGESEGGENVFIFAEKDDDGKSKCIILAVAAEAGCQLICFEGDLNLSDLEALSTIQE